MEDFIIIENREYDPDTQWHSVEMSIPWYQYLVDMVVNPFSKPRKIGRLVLKHGLASEKAFLMVNVTLEDEPFFTGDGTVIIRVKAGLSTAFKATIDPLCVEMWPKA